MRDQVFIGYSSTADAAFAKQLTGMLRKASFDVWVDVEQIPKGRDAQPYLEDALNSCKHAVFVVSPQWLEGDWTKFELRRFVRFDRSRVRIAIMRFASDDPESELPPELTGTRHIRWLDADAQPEAPFWELLCALNNQKPGPSDEWAARGREQLGLATADVSGATEPALREVVASALLGGEEAHLYCDRSRQWGDLDVILRDRRCALIFVTGVAGEAHEQFLHRIGQSRALTTPQRIIWPRWRQRPFPQQRNDLLAALAVELGASIGTLKAALRRELSQRHLLVVHPVISEEYENPLLTDFLIRDLPELIGSDQPPYAFKLVQALEWVDSGPMRRWLAWMLNAIAPVPPRWARRTLQEIRARAFVEGVALGMPKQVSVQRLPELRRIVRADLVAFCEHHHIQPPKRDEFIERVLHGARDSAEILRRIQNHFPSEACA